MALLFLASYGSSRASWCEECYLIDGLYESTSCADFDRSYSKKCDEIDEKKTDVEMEGLSSYQARIQKNNSRVQFPTLMINPLHAVPKDH